MKLNRNNIPSILAKSVQEVWKRSVYKGYPLAVWQLPNDSSSHLIIDLRPELQSQPFSIESSGSGFVVNPFGSAHPVTPRLIKADITFTWSKTERYETLSPTVSSSALDEFLEKIGSDRQATGPEPIKSTRKQTPYVDLVKKGLEALIEGKMEKVVLSRYEDHQLPDTFDPFEKFEVLGKKYPNALKYLVHLPGIGTWLGATPEELIQISDHKIFRTVALAGTQEIRSEEEIPEIAWKQKEIEEQAMVSRYIVDCFKKIRLREFEEHGPKTIKAGKLAHLKTEFVVDMSATNTPTLGSTMLELLHPTSAVCGMPLATAMDFIKSEEGYDRSFYAGFLGPVNFQNDTNIFVNLRCMQVMGKIGRFYAGAGITKDSDPDKEFQETDLKLRTMKNVIFST